MYIRKLQNGQYANSIYISKVVNGQYLESQLIGKPICEGNTGEEVIGMNATGDILVIYKANLSPGKILIADLDEAKEKILFTLKPLEEVVKEEESKA